MKLRTGLNPYGLTYHLGLQGRGTARVNPRAAGLEGFLEVAEEIGAKVVELWDGWLNPMSDAELGALRERLAARDMLPVVSSGLTNGDIDLCIRSAKALGAPMMRFALTTILCGDRAIAPWAEIVAVVEAKLAAWSVKAADAGLTMVIENHQDFTSAELAAFCERFGPAVRIVLDTANTFPVGEAPLDFVRTVAPYVRYVHLKDYVVQFTAEGYRLIRCPTGDGCVPISEIFDLLSQHHDDMIAAIEIGALDARHVRLLTPGWWSGYRPKDARALAACLLAALRNRLADDADGRTPWERGEDGALADWELAQVRRSAENMKKLNLM